MEYVVGLLLSHLVFMTRSFNLYPQPASSLQFPVAEYLYPTNMNGKRYTLFIMYYCLPNREAQVIGEEPSFNSNSNCWQFSLLSITPIGPFEPLKRQYWSMYPSPSQSAA